jgi:hypothetical protein
MHGCTYAHGCTYEHGCRARQGCRDASCVFATLDPTQQHSAALSSAHADPCANVGARRAAAAQLQGCRQAARPQGRVERMEAEALRPQDAEATQPAPLPTHTNVAMVENSCQTPVSERACCLFQVWFRSWMWRAAAASARCGARGGVLALAHTSRSVQGVRGASRNADAYAISLSLSQHESCPSALSCRDQSEISGATPVCDRPGERSGPGESARKPQTTPGPRPATARCRQHALLPPLFRLCIFVYGATCFSSSQ